MRSFAGQTVPFKIEYRYRPQEYGERLVRMYLLKNDKESNLGTTPLPDGIVRVFRDNGRDGLSYLAQQAVKYVPIGDKIELNLGIDPEVSFELVKLKIFRSDLILQIHGTNEFRKIGGDGAREDRFGPLLDLALRVRHQEQRQRGPKVYSLHAPEVECIGRGKARTPYEFGCKVSIATPATAPKGGQFVLHAKALHGNPYDGHTLGPVITDLEKLTGVAVRRIHGDKGYRGHNYPDRFRVWISGQVRRVTKVIRREMRRRAAVEPVIGHLKDDHRMRRNYLKGRDGDRINAVLAAAGYNFSLLLRWFKELLRILLLIICRSRSPRLLLG